MIDKEVGRGLGMNEYVPLAVQVALVGAVVVSTLVTSYHSRKSNAAYKSVSSMELIFKLSDRIYESERGRKIIEQIKKPDSVIVALDKQGGGGLIASHLLPHREVENFLNDVETALLLKQHRMLRSGMFEQTFLWVVDLVVEHKNLMEFIEAKQQKYGDVAWKPISDYYHSRELGR